MRQLWKKALLLAFVGIFCSMSFIEARPYKNHCRDNCKEPCPVQNYYAQLSSLTNVPLSGTNVPQAVPINSLDEVQNISVSGSEITITQDGLYLIILAGQVGWQGGALTPTPGDYLDLWLVKNGENVSNSNTRQAIEDIYQTSVLVSQTVTKLSKGDVLQPYINGPSASIGLVVSTGTFPGVTNPATGEPTSPAIIISIAKL